MKKPDLLIVDDHQIFRQGIKSIISVANIATVIGEASNGEEFLELLSHSKPDLVLLDIDMPVMDGLEATKKALEIIPDLKIIAFPLFGDEESFLRMIKLGAMGYVLKSCDISELETAIQHVLKGGTYFSNQQFTKNGNRTGNTEIKIIEQRRFHSTKFKSTTDLFPSWYLQVVS
jgi:DNA-binding NarL/FixJ family response regulator